MADPTRFAGRTAIVTGASGELGRVITRTLATCGANVAIHYWSSQAKAEALQAEIAQTGVRAMTVPG